MCIDRRMIFLFSLLSVVLIVPKQALSDSIEYDLEIAGREVDFTGHPVRAMTINGAIPGPTLRFREGDVARIRVHNTMDVETSIHWHGLLVPPRHGRSPICHVSAYCSGRHLYL
ncbi:multicopper oxidase domain-containing protein [Thermodesulfobacteriota bacterium]